MAKKNKVYFDPENKTLVVEGKLFKVSKMTSKKKSIHGSRDYMVEIKKKEYNERLNKIIEYIRTAFDEKKFLKSLLDSLTISDIEKIERRMKKGAKVVEKKGCYNIMIGDFELPVSE